MESFLNFIQSNFPALVEYKYLFLFIGSATEGLNTIVLGGFLVSTAKISFVTSYLIFVIGYTVNGYLWYTLGYFAGSKPIDKWGRSKPKSERIINTVQHYFERYSGKAIVIAKLTHSLTIVTLIMAGSLKYDLKKFSWYNFIGSMGWVMMTMSVGYFFGQSYKFFFVYLKNFTYFLIFLGSAIALIYILKWIFRSAFVKTILMHERVRYFSEKFKNGLDRFLSNGNGNIDKNDF